MPAKKQIEREKILNAAFEIVRSEGMSALNMRTLAKKCNCSTQPLYLSFDGAEDVKKCVSKMIAEYFDAFVSREIAKGEYPEYKAIGLGYIKFAKEEKELFRYLFMRKRTEDNEWEENSFEDDVNTLMKNYGYYDDDARVLHAEMWIFVHGIATMYATEFLDWKWETVSKMMTDAFKGFTSALKGEKP